MEAICTTNVVVERTDQTPELPYVNNTDLVKLQQRFDDALVYSAWYGVAMPTVAAVGVVLNAMAFRLVDFSRIPGRTDSIVHEHVCCLNGNQYDSYVWN